MRDKKINPIYDGTVIDHIPPTKSIQVAQILGLINHKSEVTIGMNLSSKKIKIKDAVKIENRSLSGRELNKIGIIAPNATINIIKHGKVIKKFKLKLPSNIERIVKCKNPNCITNNQDTHTLFHITNKIPLVMKCHYCERSLENDEFDLV